MERKQFVRKNAYKDNPLLIKFLQEEQVNGISKKRHISETSALRVVNDFKPLDAEWTKEDVNNCILKLQADGYKASSIDTYKLIIRKFFNWAGKQNIAAHLKVKTHKNGLRREDILDVDDINAMIEAAKDSPMYQALIGLLFESGARINEVLPIKRKDIVETDKGLIINIPETKPNENGEVTYRRCIFPFSAMYIRNHITYSALAPEDKLFKPCHRTIWEMLRKFGGKAGITKKVNPHAFRHAQATDMLRRGWQEGKIKKKLGWTQDSRMLGRYLHVVDEDVIDEALAMAGKEIPKQPLSVIKQPEPLKLADAASMFVKMNDELQQTKEENEQLKSNYETLKKDMEKIQKFFEQGGLDLLNEK